MRKRRYRIKALSGIGLLLAVMGACTGIARGSEISGRVTIDNWAQHDGITVWIDTVNVTTTDSLGYYLIDGVPNGDHTVYAWFEHCLVTPIVMVHVERNSVQDVDGTITRYDLNSDSRINLLDAAVILGHLGEMPDDGGWDEMLDLEADDVIDSLDVARLVDAWKRRDGTARPTKIIVTEPLHSAICNWEGTAIPIRWNNGTLGGLVRIDLFRGDTFILTIALSTENDGYFGEFIIHADLVTAPDYRFRIYLDSANFDYSDYFAIGGFGFGVTEPSRSTAWTVNMHDVPILWDPGWARGTVTITLLKGGEQVDTICASTENDGEYSEYDPPGSIISGYDYSVLVERDNCVSGESHVFQIRNFLRVLSPGTGTIWYTGQEGPEISWDTGNLGGEVRITLFKDEYGGHQWYGLSDRVAESTPNDGYYYDYKVPEYFPPGTDYFVTIEQLAADKDAFGMRFKVRRSHEWVLRDTPTIAVLWAVAFADSLVGVAVGDGGTILRTADGGVSWDSIAAGTDVRLTSVSFAGGTTGIATGQEGTILKTTDRGLTWYPLDSGTLHALVGSSMPDSLHYYAVGYSGTIVRTTDGGESWTLLDGGTGVTLRGVSFAAIDSGMALGDEGKILRTADGGETWVNIGKQELLPEEYSTGEAVWFSDPLTGTAVGWGGYNVWDSGHIWRTTDFGESWKSQKYPMETVVEPGFHPYTFDVHFLDNDRGIVQGAGTRIYLTNDGGENWFREYSPFTTQAVRMIDAETAIAVGDGGGIACRVSVQQ